jgi:hypothetical protein
MEDILSPLMKSLGGPLTSYVVTSGLLTILSSQHVMKKVTSNWGFTSLLLRTVLSSSTIVACIPELDKKGW